jgi:formamidopyrimidine-DNA glycosylase
MPELPDVEVFRKYIDATSLHKKVVAVSVRSSDVTASTSIHEIEAQVKGRAFAETSRYGKYLLVSLDDEETTMVVHFGMTGDLAYYKHDKDRPAYTKALFTFANGYHLAYIAPRKLGNLRLVKDVARFIAAKQLGPDALDPAFTQDQFIDLLAGRRGMIKSALMDQSLLAGIGNVYSDEILFQVRVHPRTPVHALDTACMKHIFDTMHDVLETAIECGADPDRFPDGYITPRRHEDGDCPACGGKLEEVDVAGRSAYFCPSCQSLPQDGATVTC